MNMEREWAAEQAVDRAMTVFKQMWEADPFQDPDADDVLGVGEEFGDFGRGYAVGRLMSYLREAPEPRYNNEQRTVIQQHIQRAKERFKRYE